MPGEDIIGDYLVLFLLFKRSFRSFIIFFAFLMSWVSAPAAFIIGFLFKSRNCSIDTKRLTLEDWKDLRPRMSASMTGSFDVGRDWNVDFFKCVYSNNVASQCLLTAKFCFLSDQRYGLHLLGRPLLIEQ